MNSPNDIRRIFRYILLALGAVAIFNIIYLLATGQESLSGNSSSSKRNFQDGVYVFNKYSLDNLNECKPTKGRCVTKAQYNTLCKSTSALTKNMTDLIVYVHGPREVSALLKGGNLDDLQGKYYEESAVCYISISVSGIYKGTSTRAQTTIRAEEFVVQNGTVALHYGSPF